MVLTQYIINLIIFLINILFILCINTNLLVYYDNCFAHFYVFYVLYVYYVTDSIPYYDLQKVNKHEYESK
jgi:hypothetical protein